MRTWDTYIVMGCGGGHPGIVIIDPIDLQIVDQLALPSGNSVYALVRTPGGFVIGTRAGRLWQVLDSPENLIGHFHVDRLQAIPHGPSGILEMCALPDGRFALANESGGCWVIDPRQRPVHRCLLNTERRVVCSMTAVGEDQVFGMTTCGQGILWDSDHGQRRISKSMTLLPELESEIHLLNWPNQDSITFPVRDGDVGVCQLKDGNLTTQQGHTGNWFYGLKLDDSLLTFGFRDHQVLSWDQNMQQTIQSEHGPNHVLDGCLLSENPLRILVIQKTGQAGVYECQNQQWQCVKEIPGDTYRTCLGHRVESLVELQNQMSQHQAKQWVMQLENPDICAGEKEWAHERLMEAGYEHVSLGIRIRNAGEDLPTTLEQSWRLIRLLEKEQQMTPQMAMNHLELLCQANQFETAWEFVQSNQTYFPAKNKSDQITQLEICHREMENADAIIYDEKGIFPQWIACAEANTAVRNSFWTIENLKPWMLDSAKQTDHQDVVHWMKEAFEHSALVRVTPYDRILFLNDPPSHHEVAFVFRPKELGDGFGVGLCLVIEQRQSGCIIQARVVFGVEKALTLTDASKASLVSVYQTLMDTKDPTYGLGPVLDHVIDQLRLLA